MRDPSHPCRPIVTRAGGPCQFRLRGATIESAGVGNRRAERHNGMGAWHCANVSPRHRRPFEQSMPFPCASRAHDSFARTVRRSPGKLAGPARTAALPPDANPPLVVRWPGPRIGPDVRFAEIAANCWRPISACGPRGSYSTKRPTTALKSCSSNWPTASKSNACCCATAREGRFALARRWAARWDACSAPVDWPEWCAT